MIQDKNVNFLAGTSSKTSKLFSKQVSKTILERLSIDSSNFPIRSRDQSRFLSPFDESLYLFVELPQFYFRISSRLQ